MSTIPWAHQAFGRPADYDWCPGHSCRVAITEVPTRRCWEVHHEMDADRGRKPRHVVHEISYDVFSSYGFSAIDYRYGLKDIVQQLVARDHVAKPKDKRKPPTWGQDYR